MNRFLHILGAVSGTVAGIALIPGLIPFAPVVIAVAGGVTTLSAYFASNPVSLANAPQAALQAATVAAKTKADVQAALSKGNPNYGK
jgi:hypothetical protein